jgi:hypothetical protein
MATRIERDYYKTLIISASGQGKTYGFRNMDANTTGFINAENKPLPFSKKFKYHAHPKKWAGVNAAFDDFAKDPAIDIIIIDSISAVFEMWVEECRANRSGYEIWNSYNKGIGELLTKIKNLDKEVVITGHYEMLNIEGAPEKRLKVKGKEWEGIIEKEFTIVLYPEIKYKSGKPERYIYKLAAEGCSAKCPPAIFGEGTYEIDNDFKIFNDKVVEFAMRSHTVTDAPTAAQVEQTIFA